MKVKPFSINIETWKANVIVFRKPSDIKIIIDMHSDDETILMTLFRTFGHMGEHL